MSREEKVVQRAFVRGIPDSRDGTEIKLKRPFCSLLELIDTSSDQKKVSQSPDFLQWLEFNACFYFRLRHGRHRQRNSTRKLNFGITFLNSSYLLISDSTISNSNGLDKKNCAKLISYLRLLLRPSLSHVMILINECRVTGVSFSLDVDDVTKHSSEMSLGFKMGE